MHALKAFPPLLLAMFLLFSCDDQCSETRQYIRYTAVYTDKAEVLAHEVQDARAITNPTKIYFKDDFVFIVESGEGIHVIDNSDQSNPTPLYFIAIPGNEDLAIMDQYLYADNYSDLLVLDVADIHDITYVGRVPDAFDYYGWHYMDASSTQIATSWEETVEEFEQECWDQTLEGGVVIDSFEGDISSGGSGVGGSMARFTIANNFLYAVDYSSIRPFDLAQVAKPEAKEPVYIGWDIETVFPYENQLFIGSQSGMHIYDITEPATPGFLSIFEHANACDPVVVQDDIAFVTLRGGTECQTFTNQLDIIDVSNLTSPELIKSYAMDNPHGLGVKDNCLYICEGDYGLKHFDISDVNDIKLLNHFDDLHALDVIPVQETLLLIGGDGFHQYEGLCQSDIAYLSTISF